MGVWPSATGLIALREDLESKVEDSDFFMLSGTGGCRFRTDELRGVGITEASFQLFPPSFLNHQSVFVWRPRADSFFIGYNDGRVLGAVARAFFPTAEDFLNTAVRVMSSWLTEHRVRLSRAPPTAMPSSSAVDVANWCL
jgi:hypothetical protein